MNTPKHGDVYRLENVSGRSDVLIHVGNWAGDVSLGYKTDSQGCILIGQIWGFRDRQLAVLQSRLAFAAFMREMARVSFSLEVVPWS